MPKIRIAADLAAAVLFPGADGVSIVDASMQRGVIVLEIAGAGLPAVGELRAVIETTAIPVAAELPDAAARFRRVVTFEAA